MTLTEKESRNFWAKFDLIRTGQSPAMPEIGTVPGLDRRHDRRVRWTACAPRRCLSCFKLPMGTACKAGLPAHQFLGLSSRHKSSLDPTPGRILR